MLIGHLHKLKKNRQVFFSIKFSIFLLYIPSFLLITVALPHEATELQDLREKDISYNVWSDTFLDFLHTNLDFKKLLELLQGSIF